MNITALVVDDEPLAQQRMQRLLLNQGVEVVAVAENGEEALSLLRKHTVDILFIDINMPVKNGLQVVNEITDTLAQPPATVFCTAYDEYAVQAFEANASAYLLKPVSADSLSKVIVQVQNINRMQVASLRESETAPAVLAIRMAGGLENIALSNILYFKSAEKHCFAVIAEYGEVLVDYTLKELNDKLADQFLRIHRSYLVNRNHMHKISSHGDGGVQLYLNGLATALPVSRRHLKSVKECFK